MKIYSSSACVVTIVCIFATFIAQGLSNHDGGNHIKSIKGKMEGNHHLSFNITKSSCKNGDMSGGSTTVVRCCGDKVYNPLNEICCESRVHTLSSFNSECCGEVTSFTVRCVLYSFIEVIITTTHICCAGKKQEKGEKDCKHDSVNHKPSLLHSTRKPPQNLDLKCGSETFNPHTQICCAGTAYKNHDLNKCCGDQMYTPADEVLCCNGTLYPLTDEPVCLGGVLYVNTNVDCLMASRPRLGQHCCGKQTFDPEKHICCDGHIHEKKKGHFCCGSTAYDPHNNSSKCCSGHHYENVNEKAECCGHFLLKHDQNYTCCSSSTYSMLYSNKSDHHCCGHHYYNKTRWSCCSEQLKLLKHPKNDRSLSNYRLKHLTDLIPEICKKGALLGKVDSMTLNTTKRGILMQVIGHIHIKNLTKECLESEYSQVLDHCSTPVLEIGTTYVWMKIESGYKPVSLPINLISDFHVFYNACKER